MLECVNPVRDKWRVRWDVQTDEEGNTTYMEEEYRHKPTPLDIERTIAASDTDASDDELAAIAQAMGYAKGDFDTIFDNARAQRMADDPQAQLMEVMRTQLLDKTDMPDAQALQVPKMFHSFAHLCKHGGEVKAGTVIRHGDKLWRVVQSHTPQAIYPPGIDTASLYTRIEPGHAGTQVDPIPYEQGMAFVQGKYYSQHGVTYLCVLTTATGYPYDLKDLPTIVQAV